MKYIVIIFWWNIYRIKTPGTSGSELVLQISCPSISAGVNESNRLEVTLNRVYCISSITRRYQKQNEPIQEHYWICTSEGCSCSTSDTTNCDAGNPEVYTQNSTQDISEGGSRCKRGNRVRIDI